MNKTSLDSKRKNYGSGRAVEDSSGGARWTQSSDREEGMTRSSMGASSQIQNGRQLYVQLEH